MEIMQLVGGGTSWYYLLDNENKVVDASHEDDRAGMNRLRQRASDLNRWADCPKGNHARENVRHHLGIAEIRD